MVLFSNERASGATIFVRKSIASAEPKIHAKNFYHFYSFSLIPAIFSIILGVFNQLISNLEEEKNGKEAHDQISDCRLFRQEI